MNFASIGLPCVSHNIFYAFPISKRSIMNICSLANHCNSVRLELRRGVSAQRRHHQMIWKEKWVSDGTVHFTKTSLWAKPSMTRVVCAWLVQYLLWPTQKPLGAPELDGRRRGELNPFCTVLFSYAIPATSDSESAISPKSKGKQIPVWYPVKRALAHNGT